MISNGDLKLGTGRHDYGCGLEQIRKVGLCTDIECLFS